MREILYAYIANIEIGAIKKTRVVKQFALGR